ncbi:MAG: acetylornithine deacetylase [Rhizobiales bacterium]|nr:acetylornithine deacetylase [Hyphomicrobiales bacterium]
MPGTTYTPRELIGKLISFDTTSRVSNLELITFVQDYLAGWGVESILLPNEDGSKSNLYATIGPEKAGGIVLSGHTDVVPVDGQAWSTDPFSVVERDGLLFGRGTSDMKAFIAIGLAKVPDLVRQNLSTPIHFALSYDEEVGCLGVRPMVEHIKQHLPIPAIVIVGEPTDMTVVNAHKSGHRFRTEITGLEGHSSLPQRGVNSIMVAGELLGEVNRIAEEMKTHPDCDHRFDPPYTTIHVGMIQGGTALNIIPLNCSFEWEARGLPGFEPSEVIDRMTAFAEKNLIPKMHAVSPDTGITTKHVDHIPALVPEDGSPAETLVMALARQNETFGVSYQTEAGYFQQADIPTVICGPGSITQAHKPDEYISISQVDSCSQFMDRLVAHAAQ